MGLDDVMREPHHGIRALIRRDTSKLGLTPSLYVLLCGIGGVICQSKEGALTRNRAGTLT